MISQWYTVSANPCSLPVLLRCTLESAMNQQYTLSFLFVYLKCFGSHFFPSSGQAVATGVIPSPPRYVPSFFRAEFSAFLLLVVSHRNLPTRAFGEGSRLGKTILCVVKYTAPRFELLQRNRRQGYVLVCLQSFVAEPVCHGRHVVEGIQMFCVLEGFVPVENVSCRNF